MNTNTHGNDRILRFGRVKIKIHFEKYTVVPNVFTPVQWRSSNDRRVKLTLDAKRFR